MFVQSENHEKWPNPKYKTHTKTTGANLIGNVFSAARIVHLSVFCVIFCRSLFLLLDFFLLDIALSGLLRFMTFELPLQYLQTVLQKTGNSNKQGLIPRAPYVLLSSAIPHKHIRICTQMKHLSVIYQLNVISDFRMFVYRYARKNTLRICPYVVTVI